MAVTWRKIAFADDSMLKALITEQGDILYGSGVATPAALAHAAAAGYLLQSGGHAANPSWINHNVMPSSAIHNNTSLCIVSMNTNQYAHASANAKIIYNDVITDLGSNWTFQNWYGAAGAYQQAKSSGCSATTIEMVGANFPASLLGYAVWWASDAAGTTNTGKGYITVVVGLTTLTISKVEGADFANSYYFWIRKAADWADCGVEGTYKHSTAGGNATTIVDSGAPFVQGMMDEMVMWASTADGVTNAGGGYIVSVDSTTQLTIARCVSLGGAAFANTYYYWIRKHHYVAPVSGYYSVVLQCRITSPEDGKRYALVLHRNSSSNSFIAATADTQISAGSTQTVMIQATGLIYAAAGDYIWGRFTPVSTAADSYLNGFGYSSGYTIFSIYCIRQD